MDPILHRFVQTGTCRPAPESTRRLSDVLATMNEIRAIAHQAAQVHEARKATATPLDRAAAWLLAELPALVTLEEAREVVVFTVARAGTGDALTAWERCIVDTWYACVVEHREAERHARLEGGHRG